MSKIDQETPALIAAMGRLDAVAGEVGSVDVAAALSPGDAVIEDLPAAVSAFNAGVEESLHRRSEVIARTADAIGHAGQATQDADVSEAGRFRAVNGDVG